LSHNLIDRPHDAELGRRGAVSSRHDDATQQDDGLMSHGIPSPAAEVMTLEARDGARLELLEMAVNSAGIGTFDWDLVGGTGSCDDRFSELFGYGPAGSDESIEALYDRVHPEDVDRVTAALQTAIESCSEFDAEYRIFLGDSQARFIATRGRVLCDEFGGAVRILGAAWDITDRAEMEAGVVRGVESMATAFFSLGTSWRFTYANGEAARVLGLPREQLIGNVIWDLFPAAVGSDFEVHYRAAMATAEPAAFEAYYPAPLDAWFEVRAWRNTDGLAVYFLDVTARHRSNEIARRAADRAALLDQLTEALIGTLASDEAARHLTQLVVPGIADWCVVTLVDDNTHTGSRHGLRNVAVRHINPAMLESVSHYADDALRALHDDSMVVRAMETGVSQFVLADATVIALAALDEGPTRQLVNQLKPESIAILPLVGRSGPVGLLTLATSQARGPFSSEDLITAHHMAARAGLVLDNARLFRQQRELAERLQRSLLTSPVEPDHAQIVVRYIPAAAAAQVGGDWHDAFMQPGGATVLVIGDVAGHDAQATATMGQIRSLLRGFGAIANDGPGEILSKTDHVMETLQVETTATAVVARLEQTAEERHLGLTRLRWSNAGHPAPMTLQPDGTVAVLDTDAPDIMLGVDPQEPRRDHEVTLARETVVLLYTDGLIERRGGSIDDGLTHLQTQLVKLANRDLDQLCDELVDVMLPPDAEDDVAIVAVKLHRQDRPRPAIAGPNRIPRNANPPPH
jgi:serine phosphatase RsbU (regulator of sigma subunit)/PAS domain-containing protein